MVRTIITPNKGNISIDVSEAYIGKQIEVLLYALDEVKGATQAPAKAGRFRGALNLTDAQYQDFQQHTKDLRNEWERDI